MRVLDLTGDRFGRLVALEVTKVKNVRSWICECDCGNRVTIPTSQLTSGNNKSCKECNISRLYKIGDRFGMLTVAEFLNRENNQERLKVRCICDCGNEKITASRNLTRGATKHCGCKTKEILSKNSRGEYGESLRKMVINNYKSNARSKGLEFNLSDEMINELFKGNCYYCGCEPSKIVTKKGFYGSFTYNGVDRLSSKEGYTPSNVVSCCQTCNYLKNSYEKEEFLEIIRKIANHHGLCN